MWPWKKKKSNLVRTRLPLDPIDGIDKEQWEEFNLKMVEMFDEIGPMLSHLLYKSKDAKNFLRIRFGKYDDPCAFDLVLRKAKSDCNVICSLCGGVLIDPADRKIEDR